jgi:hypothetical protein
VKKGTKYRWVGEGGRVWLRVRKLRIGVQQVKEKGQITICIFCDLVGGTKG